MRNAANIEITIPVLNEEKTLRENVEKVIEFFQQECSHLGEISLVIADNGSTDKTELIGLGLQDGNECVRYLKVESKGVGLALKTSWRHSKSDIVGYMDLDLATDLRHIPQAISAILVEGYDIVTGSRLLKQSNVLNRGLLRGFISKIFNFIVRSYFSTKFSDGMCGFKFLRQDIYTKLNEAGAQSNGWFFATEILIVGEKLGYKLKDIPVTWIDDPDSKVNIIKLMIEYLKAMRKLKQRISTI